MTALLIIGYLIGAALTWVSIVRASELDTDDFVDVMFAVLIVTTTALLFWVPIVALTPIVRAVSR